MKSLTSFVSLSRGRVGGPTAGPWRSVWFLTFLFCTTVLELPAQITAVIDTRAQKPGGIEGSVVHALTGVPLLYVTVDLTGTAISVLVDRDGAFRLSNLSPGTYSLTMRAPGMVSVRITNVGVAPGQVTHLRAVDLRPAPHEGVEELEMVYINASQLLIGADDYAMLLVPLSQVVVTPSRYGIAEEAMASGTTLSRSTIEALPQLAEDVYRAVSRLPGLTSTDASARFWVRGAPNDQVLSRFDGVDLIEPFHVKDFDGALSIIDLETVGRIDLITGGFTAEYGNRMAGVLEMETDTYDRTLPKHTVGASLTAVRGSSRGEFADGQANWLVSARNGYPDLLLSDQWADKGDLKTRYYDLSGKIEYRLSPTNDVSFHYLHARDTLRFEEPDSPNLESSYGSDYVWGRWRGSVGDKLVGEAVLSYSRSTWNHQGVGKISNVFAVNLQDSRSLETIGLRQDWTTTVSETALARFGFDWKWGKGGYAYHLERDRPTQPRPFKSDSLSVTSTKLPERVSIRTNRDPEGTTFGAYLAPRVRLTSRLTVEPSVRIDWQDYTADQTLSPRFNVAWTEGRTTLRAAWGIYYQAQGLHQLGVPDGDTVFHHAERSEHRVISIEHRFRSGIVARVEAYERLLSRLRPRWDNAVNVREIFPELRYDRRELDAIGGETWGLELRGERRTSQHISWAVSYTLASSRETVSDHSKVRTSVIPRTLDQRHTFSLDVGYVPSSRWSFSAAWQFHSGWPTTEVSFRKVQPESGDAYIVADLGEPFGSRLPNYHRLDLRVTRHFQFRRSALRLFADLFNAYNRKNIQGYENTPKENGPVVTTEKRALKQFSLLPNVGAIWEF